MTASGDVSLLANVTAYDYYGIVADGEWALQIDSASLGYYPHDAALSNDAAVIASSYDWISIPATFYVEWEEQLSRQGFTCAQEIGTNAILCEIEQSCDYVSFFLEDLVLNFKDDNR